MEGKERMMRANKLYDASLSGNVELLTELMEEDQLTLARLSVTSFKETPLHVAAMLGHVDFAKALVRYKPDLVSKQDSLGRSPLHLASANGYVEIVKSLLVVDADVCLLRDEDRRTPLHLAVMHGRVNIVHELARARPEMSRCQLEHGESILHSCVIHNRLEALKVLLVEMSQVDDFANVKDDNGDTILHVATALTQMKTIRYLLERMDVRVNDVNGKGFTPLDVIESLPRDLKTVEIQDLLIRSRGQSARGTLATSLMFSDKNNGPFKQTPTFVRCVEATDNSLKVKVEQPPSLQSNVVRKFLKKHSWLKKKHKSVSKKMKKEHSWVEKKRDSLMVAATVIAAMAYQAALNPPGGVWSDDKHDSESGTSIMAGTSILATYDPQTYTLFWVNNTMSFAASLSIILLLVSGVPIKRRVIMWLLMLAMWLTMWFMALTYCTSMKAITPSHGAFEVEWVEVILIVQFLVRSWLGLIAIVFLVHTCRVTIWIIKKVHKNWRRGSAKKGNNTPIKVYNQVSHAC